MHVRQLYNFSVDLGGGLCKCFCCGFCLVDKQSLIFVYFRVM